MKISELINKLQEIQKEHGDVNVVIYNLSKAKYYMLKKNGKEVIFYNLPYILISARVS